MEPKTTLDSPMEQVLENLDLFRKAYPDAMEYVLEDKICKACNISSLSELADFHKEVLIQFLNNLAEEWNMTSRITPAGENYELNFHIPITIQGREQIALIDDYSAAVTGMILQMCLFMRFV